MLGMVTNKREVGGIVTEPFHEPFPAFTHADVHLDEDNFDLLQRKRGKYPLRLVQVTAHMNGKVSRLQKFGKGN
jgi:hypothetical protein